MIKYAYYIGCTSEKITKELDTSTRLVCDKLGIPLIDIEEFSCCGAGVISDKSDFLNIVINARNFALAERENADIMVICATCLVTMRRDNYRLKKNKELRKKVNNILKETRLEYKGKIEVKHLLWVLKKDYGINVVKKYIKHPLKGIKAAPFYGCHMLRPSKYLGFENAFSPESFEEVIKAVGAEPVNYRGRLECCGFHTVAVNKKSSVKMAGKWMSNAVEKKADLLVVNCPFCHTSMDGYQKDSEKEIRKKLKIPIIHLPQLIGMAMGFSSEELGLNRHVVSTKRLRNKISSL